MKPLKQWIKDNEGLSLKPYKDSVGKLTIGYGRNLDDVGIMLFEADMMLENDIAKCERLLERYEWFKSSPNHVQDSLINMCFNLGIAKLLMFKKMIAYLKNKDYDAASQEALNSKWAKQVGDRAIQVSKRMRGVE